MCWRGRSRASLRGARRRSGVALAIGSSGRGGRCGGVLLGEGAAQGLHGAMEGDAARALRLAELLGDFSVGGAAQIAQGDDLALVLGETDKGVPQVVDAFLGEDGGFGAGVGTGEVGVGQGFGLGGAQGVNGAVMGDAEEPGFEAVGFAQLRKLAPGGEIGLGDGVLGAVTITEDGGDVAADVVGGALEEDAEGGIIAPSRLFDQRRVDGGFRTRGKGAVTAP